MIRRVTTVLFFVAYFIIGWIITDDYGITYDEAIQRRHGLVSVEYVADKLGIPHGELTNGEAGFAPYGVLYQLVAIGLEQVFNTSDEPFEYYRIRHLLNYLLFGLSLFCFHRLLRLRYPGDSWLPLLGVLALTLSPRIFGHAFFNPKDHILLVAYVAATYTLFRYLKERRPAALALHVVVSALALNTRPAALIIVAVTVGVLVAEQLFTRPGNLRRLGVAATYLVGSCLAALPFFPYLWQDTGGRVASTMTEMASYGWAGEVLLFGVSYTADTVPWFYIPVWIALTTPIVYLLFIAVGLGWSAWRLAPRLFSSKLWSGLPETYDIIQFALAIGPLLAVIVLHANLYNGWRHLHFVYPALVYFLLLGFYRLYQLKPIIGSLCLGAAMLWTASQMYRMHPHQQVYFNELVRDEFILQRYDMDYWGASYRDALLQLTDQIPAGETRRIRCVNWPCEDNVRSLPPGAREKLVLESKWHLADFVATNFIYPTERDAIPTRGEYFSDPVVELYPEGNLVIGIYRVNQ
ncbi:MAG: glycosyltransferase family 39 protein [Lewinella sp.]